AAGVDPVAPRQPLAALDGSRVSERRVAHLALAGHGRRFADVDPLSRCRLSGQRRDQRRAGSQRNNQAERRAHRSAPRASLAPGAGLGEELAAVVLFLELGDFDQPPAPVVDLAQVDRVDQPGVSRLGMDGEDSLERGQRLEVFAAAGLFARGGDARSLVGRDVGQRIEIGERLGTGRPGGQQGQPDQDTAERRSLPHRTSLPPSRRSYATDRRGKQMMGGPATGKGGASRHRPRRPAKAGNSVRGPGFRRDDAYLSSTVPPASSIFFLISSASALLTPSLSGFGADSTRVLASVRPRPVMARTSLITWIFLPPSPVRMTSNSVFSSAAAPPASPPPVAGAATATAAAAETPHASSSALASSAASMTVSCDRSSTSLAISAMTRYS